MPTTKLPASGRVGRPPNPPASYKLRDAGKAWWSWAWGLPQAHAWDRGMLYHAARRAQLEDDLAALEHVDHFDLAELLGLDEENDVIRSLQWTIGGLKRLAGGSTTLMREMRELDGRLGLNPKAMADLGWTIVPDAEAKPTPTQPPAAGPPAGGGDEPQGGATVHRLRVADPAAVAAS